MKKLKVPTSVMVAAGMAGLLFFLPAAARPGDTTRVSLPNLADQGALGTQANGNSGGDPGALSGDGRFFVFESDATNLVTGDTNGFRDVFVHDRQDGSTERVSVPNLADQGAPASLGTEGNAISLQSAISSDGRFVAFVSGATNLVTGDTNGAGDIFVHDRQSGSTERVNVDSAGNQALVFFPITSAGGQPVISADGRFVAFQSAATNLVAGDFNGVSDIFVHDRQDGSIEIVSVSSSGNQGNGNSANPSISSDGRFVAFTGPTSLVAGGIFTCCPHVFIRDRTDGTTSRISVDSAGNEGNGNSDMPSISDDGLVVAFESTATNLVTGDTNNRFDVFVHDRMDGSTSRASVDSVGNEGNGHSHRFAISGDGHSVAFHSAATNLVTGDTNLTDDVFVRDLQTATTERVSVDSAGNQATSSSDSPAVSGDGRFVSFQSAAANLVTGDTNGFIDFFTHDHGPAGGDSVGAVPNGDETPGTPLTAEKASDENFEGVTESITLNWGESCSAATIDYAVYEGVLGDFASHNPLGDPTCTTGGATTATFIPGEGDRYYLIVPLSATLEGSYGIASNGVERPQAESACHTQSAVSCE